MKIAYTTFWFRRNADSISDWFDPETFNWWYSNFLAEYCSKDFSIWFNPKLFDWGDKISLVECCIEHIDIWYDSSKFDKSYDELLIESIK